MSRPIVAVDFDGTLHPYTQGWTGPIPADEPPTPDAVRALVALEQRGYRIVILSARASFPEGRQGIEDWLRRYDLARFVDDVTATKPGAVAYVDDRAVPFHGDWSTVIADVVKLAKQPTGAVR